MLTILNYVLMAILLLCAVFLVVSVLLQKTKSAGLGAAYGSETMSFSQRGKAASKEAKLQKITVILAIVIAVLAIALLVLKCFFGAEF